MSTLNTSPLSLLVGPHDIAVEIISDGNVTAVEATTSVAGRVYSSVGTSRRDPTDVKNQGIGEALALGRAIRQLGRDILRDANEDVRKAAVVKAKADAINQARMIARAKRTAQVKASALSRTFGASQVKAQ